MRRHALAPAYEAHGFIGGGFAPDGISSDAERGGNIFLHGRNVRGDFRSLGNKHGVDVDQLAVALGDLPRGFLEKDLARRVFPFLIFGSEKLSYISQRTWYRFFNES